MSPLYVLLSTIKFLLKLHLGTTGKYLAMVTEENPSSMTLKDNTEVLM